MDIAGLILKFIGNQKLLQVPSVFAEGKNITRQVGGGIGPDSIMNQLPDLQKAFSANGLSGILQNPMATNAQSMVSNVTTSIPVISGLVNSPAGGGSSTTPAFPQFTSALKTALPVLQTYSRTTDLLTGNAAPDYTTDEFGIADTLDASASGRATLDELNAPISPVTLPSSTVDALKTLLTNVQSHSVSDGDAVTQLNTYMAPVIAALALSQQAYYNATADSTQQTLLSEVFQYLTGVPSREASFIESLMPSVFVDQVMAVNQAQAAETEANRASATPESIEHSDNMKLRLEHIRRNPLTGRFE